MRFLPLFLDLTSESVALIGSGPAAINKLRFLQSAGANVRWFCGDAEVTAELTDGGPGRVAVDRSEPLDVDFATFAVAIIAYGDARDDIVAAHVRSANTMINVVDRPDLSRFIFPAIVDRRDVVIAIGTGGASPVLARRLRERIEALLPSRVGDLAALMSRYRKSFATARHASRSLRRFWERVIDGPIGAAALSGRLRDAEAALAHAVEEARLPEDNSGTVHLVGAGPGDPDLLTLRALHVLQNADIILYDEHVPREVLARARRDAELVWVGKRRGEPGIGQDEINRRLLAAATCGKQVVRLKGGDPLIFGRGGEELDYLRRAGIATYVVPGITAALGCAAQAGIPLTFRREASRLSFVTANTADGATEVDWSGLADPNTTVVVYMGLSSAAHVRDGLIATGRDSTTPVAVLARGTRPDSKAALGKLADLPALAASVGKGPALLMIGDVVAHADVSTSPTSIEVAA